MSQLRSRVELTVEAAVPVDPVEMRAVAAELAARLSPDQLEVMCWMSAYLLEQAEAYLPEAKYLPALDRATAARLGIARAGLTRPVSPR